MGAGAGTATCAGFIQFGLGVALIVLASATFKHAGPNSCVYGAADMDAGHTVCDGLGLMAFISIAASLIISVVQGACSLLLSFPPRLLEVMLRGMLALAWTVLAIVTTVATVQADHNDWSHRRAHWRHVGLGLAWGMSVLAGCIALSALLGACCIDLPLYVICCCGHFFRQNYHVQVVTVDPECQAKCGACMEGVGLAWLLHRLFPARWQKGPDNRYHLHAPEGQGYQPIAPIDVHQQYPQQQYTIAGGQFPPYQPPHVYQTPGEGSSAPHPHQHPSHQHHQPIMAPVYAPFSTQTHLPSSVGWGVPAMPSGFYPPNPAVPQMQRPPQPSTAADVARPHAAWYPDDSPSTERYPTVSAVKGGAEPSAPPPPPGKQ